MACLVLNSPMLGCELNWRLEGLGVLGKRADF